MHTSCWSKAHAGHQQPMRCDALYCQKKSYKSTVPVESYIPFSCLLLPPHFHVLILWHRCSSSCRRLVSQWGRNTGLRHLSGGVGSWTTTAPDLLKRAVGQSAEAVTDAPPGPQAQLTGGSRCSGAGLTMMPARCDRVYCMRTQHPLHRASACMCMPCRCPEPQEPSRPSPWCRLRMSTWQAP